MRERESMRHFVVLLLLLLIGNGAGLDSVTYWKNVVCKNLVDVAAVAVFKFFC